MTPPAPPTFSSLTLRNDAALRIQLLPDGTVQRIDAGPVRVNLFGGDPTEGGPSNLWLRMATPGLEGSGSTHSTTPLLGPASGTRLCEAGPSRARFVGARGRLLTEVELALDPQHGAWTWHIRLHNASALPVWLDVTMLQDVALQDDAAILLNEYYVSHYVDLTPLQHPLAGTVLAARQNLPVGGRQPWALAGSLRRGVSFATDWSQIHPPAVRARGVRAFPAQGLPGVRLQREHALLAIQDAPLALAPGEAASLGFFVQVDMHHAAATSAADLAAVDARLAQSPAASWHSCPNAAPAPREEAAPSLFATAPVLEALDLSEAELASRFDPSARRHEEWADEPGVPRHLLSFFLPGDRHVVLQAKEARSLRPHGHLMRTGQALVPDETALTSTAWMGGVFHSMVTQGHVSINRFLSTVRSFTGLYRAHGQRVFVDLGQGWVQLGVPSAFEMQADSCTWLYRHAQGCLAVRSTACHAPQRLGLEIEVIEGPSLPVLVTHHVALGGDDGRQAPPPWHVDDRGRVVVAPPADSALAQRFPAGCFVIAREDGAAFDEVHADEALHADRRPRGQPFVCVQARAAPRLSLAITGRLVDTPAPPADMPLPRVGLQAVAGSAAASEVARLDDSVPWFTHDALVHFLAPRGLEQFSGGGWGTRDVCQGPLEMLLALGRHAPVRELLRLTFSAQNPDGDWPQWFMFFSRDAAIRAGDSHGDIVFWPLLGLAHYLLSSGDASMLDEALPFHGEPGGHSVWQHVQRALACIGSRCIGGTSLAAYGHGDWNDSLQPADPALRERMCSSWTVTLHHQMLVTLARALRHVGHAGAAGPLEAQAARVREDFNRLLVADGTVAGYAIFPDSHSEHPQLLLHPRDTLTGLRHSLLPMMHAVLEDMLPEGLARQQIALVKEHLTGPDGARLFDAPMAYSGGPQRLFQRAESAAYFGREIGVMYMHAHLRWAQTLAHAGDGRGFVDALLRASPVGLRESVPMAGLRQANCYHSSSDADFSDRHQARREYGQLLAGLVRVHGGWRVYSSGPGIAMRLVVQHLVGCLVEEGSLVVDPVLPPGFDGLRVQHELWGRAIEIVHRTGPHGCGPVGLALNGAPLPFTVRAHRLRAGAAVVAGDVFRARLRDGLNQLEVRTR
ncbi:MAG: hypothetical protein RI988_130 [Pseudomonadota bacterium]|jgi:cellobiose phosphorylase